MPLPALYDRKSSERRQTMTQQPFAPHEGQSILTQISEGMPVYDRENDKVGTVRSVHLGAVSVEDDRRGLGPATTSAEEATDSSLLEDFARIFAPEALPEPVRARLLRHGFIRIDTTGLFAADRYAMPEQIGSVSGDRVTLQVTGKELLQR
jgi:hypothetical protein